MKVQTTTVLSILLTGCAVGPNYHRPLVSTPEHWAASNAQGTKPGAPVDVDQWWRSFHDTELDSLIQRAVTANYDLAQASARVSEARASVGTARSSYSPQVNAGASATRDRQIGIGLAPRPGGAAPVRYPYEVSDYSGDLSLSWEVDLFGRIRRSV